jgi:hypothetical protein
MEEEVKDAILTRQTKDAILITLIDIARMSIRDERPISNSLLEEPVFWRRHFLRWVREGLNELEIVERLEQG